MVFGDEKRVYREGGMWFAIFVIASRLCHGWIVKFVSHVTSSRRENKLETPSLCAKRIVSFSRNLNAWMFLESLIEHLELVKFSIRLKFEDHKELSLFLFFFWSKELSLFAFACSYHLVPLKFDHSPPLGTNIVNVLFGVPQ